MAAIIITFRNAHNHLPANLALKRSAVLPRKSHAIAIDWQAAAPVCQPVANRPPFFCVRKTMDNRFTGQNFSKTCWTLSESISSFNYYCFDKNNNCVHQICGIHVLSHFRLYRWRRYWISQFSLIDVAPGQCKTHQTNALSRLSTANFRGGNHIAKD